jgi:hypothetical protein
LILLSRSGPRNKYSASIKEELKIARVETPACNIADAVSLKSCLENCLKDMPPIRGCIQAAVELRVILLPRMSTSTIQRADTSIGQYFYPDGLRRLESWS